MHSQSTPRSVSLKPPVISLFLPRALGARIPDEKLGKKRYCMLVSK